MKGGVGKTTISGNLFRELYKFLSGGSKTLLIDFDAQFNLTQLVLTRTEYEGLQKKNKTLWNVFEPGNQPDMFTVSNQQRTTVGDYKDFVERLKLTGKKNELLLVPGDFKIALLNLREKPESLEMPRKRFRDFMKKARAECALVVLDCNPSSSFLTRCAIEEATHILVPIRPDKYSVLGLEILAQYIDHLPLVNPPEFLVIMNGVDSHISPVEQEVRAHAVFGPNLMVTRILRTKVLEARTDFTGFGVDRGAPYTHRVRSMLEDASNEIIKKLKLPQ